jgi:hypothetical protein
VATHLVIDLRARQVHASQDAPGEGTTFFAVDLITDTWDDFQYFLEQGRVFEHAREWRRRNRYVRVATAALFAHLDGSVSGIFELLSAHGQIRPFLPKQPRFASLKTRAQAIHGFLEAEHKRQLPPLSLALKPLRDILNHPTASKKRTAAESDLNTLRMIDVYGIAIEDLEKAGGDVSQWLDAVCPLVPFDRFIDTKKAIDAFTHALGLSPGEAREF